MGVILSKGVHDVEKFAYVAGEGAGSATTIPVISTLVLRAIATTEAGKKYLN